MVEQTKTKTKKAVADTIKVMQFGSAIRRDGRQLKHLKALGLGRINQVRELQNIPSVQGLLKKVAHMVKVVD
jgi:large subunit ribosomal protein L30